VWSVRFDTLDTTVAPDNGVLAKPAIAFKRFGDGPAQDLENSGVVLMSLGHTRSLQGASATSDD
jgi:hypothetical protein